MGHNELLVGKKKSANLVVLRQQRNLMAIFSMAAAAKNTPSSLGQ
jgi:hypothetical protein